MAIVALDLDGVMYNFHDALRQWLHQSKGIPLDLMPEPVYWAWDNWGWEQGGKHDKLTECNAAVDAGFLFAVGDPYEGAVEGVQALEEAGHHIHIITARGFGTRSVENTAAWLREHRIPYHSITFTKDKHLIHFDLLIDDLYDNVRATIDSGKKAALWPQVWNEEYEDVPRVDDWNDVLELCATI